MDRVWMSSFERQLRILQIISKKPGISEQVLADCFNVTPRTIRKDIQILSLSYPIESTRGKHGGVKLDNENKNLWPPMFMSLDQINGVIVAACELEALQSI